LASLQLVLGSSKHTMDYSYFATIEAENTFCFFAAGDEAALGIMYRRFYGPLMRYGCHRLENEFEVATIVQEAFTRLWDLRSRIISLLHAYRFLRLVVRWGCANYYRNPAACFHRRCILYSGSVEGLSVADDSHHGLSHAAQEEQVQIVYKVIPYLPLTRQTVLRLYFSYGFSCKQIAARFHTSNSAVSRELQQSLDFLKSVICGAKRAAAPPIGKKLMLPSLPPGLTSTQQQVYQLRAHEKRSFFQIADVLNLPQSDVQAAYVQACRWLAGQRNATGKRRPAPSFTKTATA